jgi:dUTPase
LDNNAKLPIRGSDLAAGIDIMANQDMIIPLGE